MHQFFSYLTIHIVADNNADNALYDVINTTTSIQSWITYHQISIRIIESYNIRDYNNNDHENNQNEGYPLTIYQYVLP